MMYEELEIKKGPTLITNTHMSSLTRKGLQMWEAHLPTHKSGVAWGIDPGVSFGITIINGRSVHIYFGELNMEREAGAYGLRAFQFLENMISAYSQYGARATIEGAAYTKAFGQVKLGEIRDGFYVAAGKSPVFQRVEIKPPATIRATVFGKGKSKTQAGDIWPTVDHNAADSIAMALYSVMADDEELG